MARPTHGNCEGLSGIQIIKGHYGSVELDNLNAVSVYSWPGPIHEGHGKASFYIDDRATEEQFDVLSKVVTGAVGGPAEIYATTLDSFQKPRKARISLFPRGLESRVKVEGVGEVKLESMKNPVTGEVHRAIIELPTGFEANRMEVASLEKLVVDDGYLNFKYSGTYAHFTETRWKGP
jgi:hypothetical protein